MEFKIKAIDRGNFIQIQLFGEWTEMDSEEVFVEMAKSILASGHKKVLFDYRDTKFMEDSFFMDKSEAEALSRMPNVFEFRFASVFKSETEVARFKYWESIATSRAVKIKFFSNYVDAKAWLLKTNSH